MSWLLITILAYFFLAVVSLFDRYFLIGSIPNPRVYTFYVGIVWFFLCFIFIPFGISFPTIDIIVLGLSVGLIRIFAILFLAKSLFREEVSRVVPAIGGFLPIFSFLLFFIFFPESGLLNLLQIAAFILLVCGSALISIKKFDKGFLNFKDLRYPILSAFLFALNFFLIKNLFLRVSFLDGFFFLLLGGGLGAVIFLIFKEVRKDVFAQKITTKISGIFLAGQIFGGLGVLLQNYAVFLAMPYQVPLINALEGARYVFLLFFVFLLAKKFPQLLKEEIGGKIIFQKIFAILFIGAGLAILAIK